MINEIIVKSVIEFVENGWVPDWLTRRAIRRLCTKRLRSLDAGSDDANEFNLQTFIDYAKQSPIALVPEKANEQHYEVPAELYAHILGRRRKYSCCYWPGGVSTLDEAEVASLRITCEHAQLEDGMRVLELGCGWGALSLWIAENYPHCSINAVSNSHSQREFIERRAEELGFSDRLTVVTADMNDFASPQAFDRVMSVEMFEHMRNYEELLRRISGWLTDEGKLFVHTFCHHRFAYEFNDKDADDWMARHFFTGGIMPSDDLLSHFSEHMRVAKHWRWNGRHYELTAEAWVANLDQRRDQIMPILAATYGDLQARRWWMRWRLLFLAGAELFGYRKGEEWYVAHYLLEPSHCDDQANRRILPQRATSVL